MRSTTAVRRRRAAAARRCRDCGEIFALQMVQHPAGLVIRCRKCGATHRGATAPTRIRVPT